MEQLTSDQIQAVDTFVRDRYIQYEDVRIEIVDHLATEIEAEMALNSDDSFTKLLWKVGDKYGPELKKLVKLSERKMVWFWVKHLFVNSLKSIYSPYALIPIILYFITINTSFAVGISCAAVLVIIMGRNFIGWRDEEFAFAESQKFLATKAYNTVVNVFIFYMIILTVRPYKGVWELTYFSIDKESFYIAFMMSYFLFVRVARNLLESYYTDYPIIAARRNALRDQIGNRKWKARKY